MYNNNNSFTVHIYRAFNITICYLCYCSVVFCYFSNQSRDYRIFYRLPLSVSYINTDQSQESLKTISRSLVLQRDSTPRWAGIYGFDLALIHRGRPFGQVCWCCERGNEKCFNTLISLVVLVGPPVHDLLDLLTCQSPIPVVLEKMQNKCGIFSAVTFYIGLQQP